MQTEYEDDYVTSNTYSTAPQNHSRIYSSNQNREQCRPILEQITLLSRFLLVNQTHTVHFQYTLPAEWMTLVSRFLSMNETYMCKCLIPKQITESFHLSGSYSLHHTESYILTVQLHQWTCWLVVQNQCVVIQIQINELNMFPFKTNYWIPCMPPLKNQFWIPELFKSRLLTN